MDKSTINKFQQQFWVTKQTVFRKLGKKEDDCIVASDAALDAKLELFKSIRCTSSAMNKLLDRYQERICYLAQEQNSMGRFLKEYGKTDKSGAGKMMIQMGKSLIYCSQQEIGLRPPLLRLYQEVETFRSRAVEDTLDTIKQMENKRTEYRASLKWMKNVSQELDPDTYKQMEKFRKVQGHVKKSKGQFDKLKLACLQKVDLLAAARCNMFSHALIQYQHSTMTTTEKNARVFDTLASAFKGYQHYEFSVIKDLIEPKKLAEDQESGVAQDSTNNEGPLFDFGNDDEAGQGQGDQNQREKSFAEIGSFPQGKKAKAKPKAGQNDVEKLINTDDNSTYENASLLLENLLGPLDQSPETETANEALDLGLSWPSSSDKSRDSGPTPGKTGNQNEKTKSSGGASDLLSEDLDTLSFENDSSDTMALLNELLNTSSSILQPEQQQTLVPTKIGGGFEDLQQLQQIGMPGPSSSQNPFFGVGPSSSILQNPNANPSNNFLPSRLLDLDNLDSTASDLLNFTAPPLNANASKTKATNKMPTEGAPGAKSWYDIFADLDPIANPDAIGKKETEESDNRYC